MGLLVACEIDEQPRLELFYYTSSHQPAALVIIGLLDSKGIASLVFALVTFSHK